ncbi:MAG TPA: DUF177 domain-containing protein [Anaerolineales bacterium]
MANPRKPLRINVGFLVNQEVGYSHEFPFEFKKIQVSDDLSLRDFSGLATMGRTPQGLLVQGEFSGETTLQCVRCLTDYEHRLRWDLTELYAFKTKSVTDSGLIVPEDAQIDLAPLMREYALLEVPINPLCRPDCKGLCPVCGENRNDVDCGHRPQQDDSPFAVLKNLL